MTAKYTILIADDDQELLDLLSTRCQQLGLDVITAHDAMTALSCADFTQPDLVCLDVRMPAGNGLSVCEMMATDQRLRSVPVIIMTGSSDKAIQQRCRMMGAHYILKSKHLWVRLKPLICQLLQIEESSEAAAAALGNPAPAQIIRQQVPRTTATCLDVVLSTLDPVSAPLHADENDPRPSRTITAPWVLCIDDDSDFSFGLKQRLAEYGVDVLRAFGGMEGYRYAFSSQAQAIVLDYEMPDGNGDYVLRRLKENPVTKDIPVIVLTGHRNNTLISKMFNMGATAYFAKPVRWEELWEAIKKHLTLPETVQV